jgi:large subunit ribosomal protein L18
VGVEKNRHAARLRRHRRVRRRVVGSPHRPRLCVVKTLRHTYAQVIDDSTGRTLAAASTLSPAVREQLDGVSSKSVEAAHVVGRVVAERAQAVGVTRVVFDRGGWKYHGRVKAVAEAAREAGLEF